MSFTLLAILILSTTTALIFRKNQLGFVFTAFAVVWMIIVGCGILPFFALNRLQVNERVTLPNWKSRNIIVVLGGGLVKSPQNEFVSPNIIAYSRIHEAARLYFACKFKAQHCSILVSGGDPLKIGISEAEVMSRELKEIGVLNKDVILESKSNNTFQNAQFSSEVIRAQQFDQVVLVTSGFHMQRAIAYFSHFLVDAIPSSSDQFSAILSPFPISYNFTITDLALHEYAGLIRFRIYNHLGWNPIVYKPGSL